MWLGSYRWCKFRPYRRTHEARSTAISARFDYRTSRSTLLRISGSQVEYSFEKKPDSYTIGFNQFWMNAKIEGVVTNRAYDSIFRLAEAQPHSKYCISALGVKRFEATCRKRVSPYLPSDAGNTTNQTLGQLQQSRSEALYVHERC